MKIKQSPSIAPASTYSNDNTMPRFVRIGLCVFAISCDFQGLAFLIGALPATFSCGKGCWLPIFLTGILGERHAGIVISFVYFALAFSFLWLALFKPPRKSSAQVRSTLDHDS